MSVKQIQETSISRVALIVLTAPPEADMSCYFSYFRSYPIEDCPRDTNLEVRYAALDYLEERLESIK